MSVVCVASLQRAVVCAAVRSLDAAAAAAVMHTAAAKGPVAVGIVTDALRAPLLVSRPVFVSWCVIRKPLGVNVFPESRVENGKQSQNGKLNPARPQPFTPTALSSHARPTQLPLH